MLDTVAGERPLARAVGGASSRRLVAFARTHLGAGDRRRMGLSFPAARLAPGTYRVTVGERTETVTVG